MVAVMNDTRASKVLLLSAPIDRWYHWRSLGKLHDLGIIIDRPPSREIRPFQGPNLSSLAKGSQYFLITFGRSLCSVSILQVTPGPFSLRASSVTLASVAPLHPSRPVTHLHIDAAITPTIRPQANHYNTTIQKLQQVTHLLVVLSNKPPK